jgi:2-C-methyl-D-erythritol 2,4-cyclodiphosphate synthase
LGYDLHRLEAGRRLVLGGVEIPHTHGPVAHSDGDVVLHALTDALLGACGQPDIGELFPDSDPQWREADSRVFVEEAVRRARAEDCFVGNVDCIIHAERPKLTAWKRPIAENIARLLAVASERISVKAKTGEGLGAIGGGEAISATVVILVSRRADDRRIERP